MFLARSNNDTSLERSSALSAKKIQRVTKGKQDILKAPRQEAAPDPSTRSPAIARRSSSSVGPVPIPLPNRQRRAGVHSTRNYSVRQDRFYAGAVRHKSNALPPTVAALLAVTAIPVRRFDRSDGNASRDMSIDDLVAEWKRDSGILSTPSPSGSPLAGLLNPPEKSAAVDFDSRIPLSAELDTLPSRSQSSDSLPSLEADEGSIRSLSGPCTPQRSITPPNNGGRRSLVSAMVENCISDHPLMPTSNIDYIRGDFLTINTAPLLKRPPTKKLSRFKSNLTASIQALKSAARTLSSLHAPSVPPEDLVYGGVFPRRLSEQQPNSSPARPRAQQRNENLATTPSTESLVPERLFGGDWDPEDSLPMIQLLNYSRCPAKQNRKRADRSHGNEVFADSVPPMHLLNARQREPRENSDFLRVIVLEMNMRRGGKLDPHSGGRARVWLPPREAGVKQERRSGVPPRWIPVSCGGSTCGASAYVARPLKYTTK